MTTKKKAVYFTLETFHKLIEYIIAKHGSRRAFSITVNQAVEEYLAAHEPSLSKAGADTAKQSSELKALSH